MKAISLHQPWATLCAIGAKMIETRGRDCHYRGELAIHAAKRWERDQYDQCFVAPFFAVLKAAGFVTYHHGIPIVALPLGKILAVTFLAETRKTSLGQLPDDHPQRWVEQLSTQERAFGNFDAGRFGYTLIKTRPLRQPVACRGMQAVPFEVPPEVADVVRRMLAEQT